MQESPTKHKAAIDKLHGKQRRFVKHYLQTWNATQSYIAAGYAPKSAGREAYTALKKPIIQAAIAECLEAEGLGAGQVKAMVALLAFGVPSERFASFLAGREDVSDLAQRDAEAFACVKAVSQTTTKNGDSNRRVEFIDRLGALRLLAQVLGLLTDKSEVAHSFSDWQGYLRTLPPDALDRLAGTAGIEGDNE